MIKWIEHVQLSIQRWLACFRQCHCVRSGPVQQLAGKGGFIFSPIRAFCCQHTCDKRSVIKIFHLKVLTWRIVGVGDNFPIAKTLLRGHFVYFPWSYALWHWRRGYYITTFSSIHCKGLTSHCYPRKKACSKLQHHVPQGQHDIYDKKNSFLFAAYGSRGSTKFDASKTSFPGSTASQLMVCAMHLMEGWPCRHLAVHRY